MKLWNYIIIITGLALFLEIAGISVSGFKSIFDLIGISLNSTGFTSIQINNNFWAAVFGSSGILIAISTGVIIGIITRTSPENYIILGLITGTLFIYGSILYGIASYSLNFESWISAIVVLLLVPLGIGFILASVEFFRGTD